MDGYCLYCGQSSPLRHPTQIMSTFHFPIRRRNDIFLITIKCFSLVQGIVIYYTYTVTLISDHTFLDSQAFVACPYQFLELGLSPLFLSMPIYRIHHLFQGSILGSINLEIGLKPHSTGIFFSKLIFLLVEKNLLKLKVTNGINIINFIYYN